MTSPIVPLKALFQLLFRMIPFPTEPRLMRIGNPGRQSPVLITTNYDLTVRRLCGALRGVDCYLLIAPAGGLDVWCAAVGKRFSIDSIISILKTSRVSRLVDHRRLILPKLSAAGINIFELKRRTGWTGILGPIAAEDIPEFLSTRRNSKAMSRVGFPIRERLEMATALWGSLTLRFAIFPWLAFGRQAVPWFVALLFLLAFAVSLGCFVIPGKTFVQKAALIGLPMYMLYTAWSLKMTHATALLSLEALALVAFAAFLVGSSFPSYSPFWPCGYSKLFYGACDFELSIAKDRCIGCRICDQACPVECFAPTGNKKVEFVNPDVCVGCGACLIQCPTGAIVNEVAVNHLQEAACK